MYHAEQYKEECRMSLECGLEDNDVHCPACGSEEMGAASAKDGGRVGIIYCCDCDAKFRYDDGVLTPMRKRKPKAKE